MRGQHDRPAPTPYLRPSKAARRRRHRSAVSTYSVAKPPSPAAAAAAESTSRDGRPPTSSKTSDNAAGLLSVCRGFGNRSIIIIIIYSLSQQQTVMQYSGAGQQGPRKDTDRRTCKNVLWRCLRGAASEKFKVAPLRITLVFLSGGLEPIGR